MCRASYQRKNVVDRARAWSQYLRSILVVAKAAAVRTGPNRKLLREKVQEESSMATKKKAKKKKH